MSKMAPSGPVYQAGTLSGNPLAMEAGLAMLGEIRRDPPYARLEELGALLEREMRAAIDSAGAADRATWQRVGSIGTLFFTTGELTSFAEVERSDTEAYARFFHAMRERGVFLPPAQFEAWFLSTAHTEADVRKTARAAAESLRAALPGVG
jgi:glutamate-1-semialdehyde 2,1-aminomutase